MSFLSVPEPEPEPEWRGQMNDVDHETCPVGSSCFAVVAMLVQMVKRLGDSGSGSGSGSKGSP
jgi:hypothetical protein